MKKACVLITIAAMAAACSAPHFDKKEYDSLKQAFINPPQSAKPMVWWHWMDGNITKDGLRKDIEWMHRSGIGGFHVFDAALETPQMVQKRLEYMSPEWKEAFAGAIALADSLGMEVAIASSPGWSSTGGPWVKPEDAMKKLTWSTRLLEGGRSIEVFLPEPFTVSSRFLNVPLPYEYNHHQDGPIPEWYYQDIAVYAVKLPDNFRTLQELGAIVTSSGGSFDVCTLTDGNLDNAGLLPAHPSGFAWLQYEFPEPQSFKAVTIVNRVARSGGHGVAASCIDSLQISDDGSTWRTLCGITQGAAQEQTEYIPEAKARFWRLKCPNPQASYHYGILRLPAAPATEVGEFNLLSHIPVNHFEEKAGFAYTCDLALYHSDPSAQASEVIDISANCKGGVLHWNAPEGRWMIYRFGTSLVGKKNHPASAEATGLEVDKLDKSAFGNYIRTYLDMYKEAARGLLGEHGIQYLLIDSYESGAQTWTPTLPEEFRARRGYDLLPWLPAIAGVVVESMDATERFLWDFRRTIGELFAENYDNVTRICRNEYGMRGGFFESHEHGRNCPADGISIKKTAAYPMSAMWIQSTLGGSRTRAFEGLADIRESASTAHIYGQKLVAAESLTAAGVDRQAYSYCPETLKPTADLELAAGVNRFVIHESAHQPLDDSIPGMGMYVYGQWFNRHECWAEQARPWIDYITRSCAMMQQGRYVADFLYYYGEDTNITAQFSRSSPDVPFGYSFDFAGPEVLLKEVKAENGRLVTRSGMQYRSLYVGGEGLPVSEEIRARIDAFRKAGVRVVEGGDIADAVSGIDEDLRLDDCSDLLFVHRSHPSAEIYWLDNRRGNGRSAKVSFRCSGRKPMLWDPEIGTMRELSYEFVDGRTVVPLEFNAWQAYFVVFAEPTSERSKQVHKPVLSAYSNLEGPWMLVFQPGRGAPDSILMPELELLDRHPNPGVKYFSGTVVYKNNFEFEKGEGRFELDLGKVYNIAEVKLNGTPLRTLWRAPFRVDITDVLRNGTNEIEIAVTNLWPNRLIGDEQSGVRQRITYTTWPFYKAGDPLLPSGLEGPVSILLYDVPADYSHFANPDFARRIADVPELTSQNMCPYDFVFSPSADTPAPAGYKPFYISHYGRHGSRSDSKSVEERAEKVKGILLRAAQSGALSAEGAALASELDEVIACTDSMYGRLTSRGRREHAAIAGRMCERFPEVFSGKGRKVDVISSEYPRCLVSMASFTNRLCEEYPDLEVSQDCGSRIQEIVMNHHDTLTRRRAKEIQDSLFSAATPDYGVMLRSLFTDPAVASELVKDPAAFARHIWYSARVAASFDLPPDLYKHLPLDVRYAFSEANRAYIYFLECNSLQYGHLRVASVENLATHFVETADDAISTGTCCANLRFGHDWPLLAISSRFGIEGVGERYDLDGVLKHFVATDYSPLAGNLQLVFYRSHKAADPVLVKVLLNEKERRINGIEPVSGPYYRWKDVRSKISCL